MSEYSREFDKDRNPPIKFQIGGEKNSISGHEFTTRRTKGSAGTADGTDNGDTVVAVEGHDNLISVRLKLVHHNHRDRIDSDTY